MVGLEKNRLFFFCMVTASGETSSNAELILSDRSRKADITVGGECNFLLYRDFR